MAVLLFEIGLETDLKAMARVGTAATSVAVVGVVVPFGLGFLYWMSPLHGYEHTLADPVTTAIFVGATLTATSVGITARILIDLKCMHTVEARLVLGAAVIDDVLGLVILGVVTGVAAGSGLSLLGVTRTLAVAVGFLVAAVAVGSAARAAPVRVCGPDARAGRVARLGVRVPAAARRASRPRRLGADHRRICRRAHCGGHESVPGRLGAHEARGRHLHAGVLSEHRGRGGRAGVESVRSRGREVLMIGAALFVIAVAGKLASGWAFPWLRFNRWAVGIGMAPRGEVGLIFAQIGLAAGILTNRLFSAILLMVIGTTLIAPPLLKWAFVASGEHRAGSVPSVSSAGKIRGLEDAARVACGPVGTAGCSPMACSICCTLATWRCSRRHGPRAPPWSWR